MNWIKTAIAVETRGMSLASGLVFFLGLPLTTAFLMAWNYVLVGPDTPMAYSFVFWIGLTAITWSTSILCANASYFLLQKWQPPLFLVLLCGQVISLFVFTLPIRAYFQWGLIRWASEPPDTVAIPLALSAEYAVHVFSGILPAAIIWFSINYFYKSVLEIPRYHYGAWEPETRQPHTPQGMRQAPAFLKRLPDPIKGDVLALKAEDHYVRVFTDKGNSLIHYRFKDALADISSLNGVQTHRSYWVEQSAITDLESDGQSLYLALTTGLKVPVSRTYVNDVKRFVAGIPA